MRVFYYLILLVTVLSLLSGCSWLHPYHPPIEQGNKLTQKQIHQLEKGMTKNQVINLLGQPVLQTPWRDHQMLYVYTFRAGRDASLTEEKQVIISLKHKHVQHIQINQPK